MLWIELAELLVIAVLAYFGADAAVDGVLVKAQHLGGEEVRSVSAVRSEALRATFVHIGGLLVLAVGRLVSGLRGRGDIVVPFLLPGAAAAATIGFCLQIGYGDPIHREFWPGPQFAQGFLMASIVAAIILALPRDPTQVFLPLVPVLPFLMIGTFVALSVWGTGTEMAQDTLINLWGFQPLEVVKLLFVIFLALYFGRRAEKLRYQRETIVGLSFPRWRLMGPAFLVLVALFAAFVVVRDLGATLILSIAFVALFYVVTRASGWVLAALAAVAVFVYAAVNIPAISRAPKVALRLAMWVDPWYNGLPFGDQTALGLWAIASGGLTGQGLGFAPPVALPAGHTDLAIAHLAEELGALGVVVYLALIAAVVGQGLWVAAMNRTPERMVLATGLSVLVLAQWTVIFSGTTAVLPLTGVIAPFLAYGKTSMFVFLAVVAMLTRLAESGQAREATSELLELRTGALRALAAATVLILGAVAVIVTEGVIMGDTLARRGVVTLLEVRPGDPNDRIAHRFNPRLEAIAQRIGRGEILDRKGKTIAGTTPEGRRTYPLKDALGTVLGPPAAVVLRPLWNLERLLEPRLRGYPEHDDGPGVWMAASEERERMLFVVRSQVENPEDRSRAETLLQPGETARLLPLPNPDFTPLLPLLKMGGMAREEAITRLAADRSARSVRVTLDAELQQAAADILKVAAKKGEAAAAVVVDADSGQVLARAQVPDFDPGSEAFRRKLQDPRWAIKDPKFIGMYGAWPDKTGIRGIFQAGSVGKLFTAIAAARTGRLGGSPSYVEAAGPKFPCTAHDGQGPYFTRPGWYKAIHDHPLDSMHGNLEFVHGLEVSCNVYFGQLGLDLGPDEFRKLRDDGVEVGWGGPNWDPGKAGSRDLASTAFGQAAMLMSVSQAARLGTTIAVGGLYRRCPASMELDAKCEEKRVVPDPNQLGPVLSGMYRVMTGGTGRGLRPPAGVRMYGKTGTADSIGNKEERYYGVDVGVYGKPHSWFVGIAEPEANVVASPAATKRIVIAVVVPRGGMGSRAAGPAAVEIVNALQRLGYLPPPAPGVPATPGTSSDTGKPEGTLPADASQAPDAPPMVGVPTLPAPPAAAPASPTTPPRGQGAPAVPPPQPTTPPAVGTSSAAPAAAPAPAAPGRAAPPRARPATPAVPPPQATAPPAVTPAPAASPSPPGR